MAVCDCCHGDKTDAKIRVGLRGVDHRGKTTANPFHGPLCNDCLARTSRFGSPEQRWLFQQILQKGAPARIVQPPSVTRRQGVVVSFRPVRAKPVEGPRH